MDRPAIRLRARISSRGRWPSVTATDSTASAVPAGVVARHTRCSRTSSSTRTAADLHPAVRGRPGADERSPSLADLELAAEQRRELDGGRLRWPRPRRCRSPRGNTRARTTPAASSAQAQTPPCPPRRPGAAAASTAAADDSCAELVLRAPTRGGRPRTTPRPSSAPPPFPPAGGAPPPGRARSPAATPCPLPGARRSRARPLGVKMRMTPRGGVVHEHRLAEPELGGHPLPAGRGGTSAPSRNTASALPPVSRAVTEDAKEVEPRHARTVRCRRTWTR